MNPLACVTLATADTLELHDEGRDRHFLNFDEAEERNRDRITIHRQGQHFQVRKRLRSLGMKGKRDLNVVQLGSRNLGGLICVKRSSV